MTFLILRRTQRDMITKVYSSSCEELAVLLTFPININFLDRLPENPQIFNFTKIRPVGTELFHADRRTDRHDEANSRFSQLSGSA